MKIERVSPLGKLYFIEKPNSVAIAPMIGESVVMLELQRHGSEGRRCEFPGGRVEAGQSELEAAEQELAEEIGVRPDVLCYEGRLSPLPGVVSETVALYSAF